ncbi:hypothetical protein SDC9_94752 [bioreactor metagenome]|uniref:Uncharacterized protein n=1 Tax=bioreactor metagenome TaxID=1076179 RepID=A0A645A6W8_9ZZZZ
MGEVVFSVLISGNALNQNRHLLVQAKKSPVHSVGKGILIHRTGINRADCLFEGFVTFVRGPLIGAKHTFIFPGKGVSEIILKQGTGAHNNRGLSKVFQHLNKLLLNVLRKFSVQEFFFQLGRVPVISFFRLLLGTQSPPAVLNDIRIKNIRAEIKGIMRLQKRSITLLALLLQYLSGQKHADAFPADKACSNLSGGYHENIAQGKIPVAQLKHP